MQKDEQGKTVPVSRGIQVLQDENVPYEFMVQIQMLGDGYASVLCPISIRGAFEDDERISEETGARVAEWLGDVKRDLELELLIRTAGDEAEHGTDALKEFWGMLTKEQQLKLKPRMEVFKSRAAEIDATPAASNDAAAAGGVDLKSPFSAAAE